MPPVRQNGRGRSEEPPFPEDTTQAQTEPHPEDTKSYTLRIIKGSAYRAPFEELYARNYTEEWTKRLSKNLPVPKDPRPRRLKPDDITCVKKLGQGVDDIFLAQVERRKKHPLDAPFAMALKCKRRQQRGALALQFQPLTEDGEERVPDDLVLKFRQHFTDFNAEKVCLVNMTWSPWVAGLLQTMRDTERIYLGLEYIPGGDLRALLRDAAGRGGLTLKEARFYYSNIVMALDFLEFSEIAHCDLKPENILLGADGYLVLTDFGISASVDNWDASWKELGTACYKAPETVLHTPFDPADMPHMVDWWASGIILYEMVTGAVPFMAATQRATEDLVADCAWGWPEGVRVGDHLKALITKLLTRDPYDRLGRLGARQVQAQPWLSPVDWDKMSRRRYLAPHVPKAGRAADRWSSLPLSVDTQAHFPGVRILPPPMHLAADNRFPQRPPVHPEE